MVKSMDALLVEQGFIFSQLDSSRLDFSNESELNVKFLKKILNQSNWRHEWQGRLLTVEDILWEETEWLTRCAVGG